MNDQLRVGRLATGSLVLAWLLVACGSAATPATPATPAGSGSAGSAGASVAAGPSVSLPPDAPVSQDPVSPGTGGGSGNGADPGARDVIPRPGQLDVRPIPAETIKATLEGRAVTLTITWLSGVEPCSILDSIVIDRGDHRFAVTLREGHGPQEIACIMIGETHRTVVALGELPAGTYTVVDAVGGAAPIEVTVP
ncbi:MAG: hypothetical protein WKF56_00315 [Candidatus Limnocylindrales bacterium]